MHPLHAIRAVSFKAGILRRTQNLVASQLEAGACPTCLGPLGSQRDHQVICADCRLDMEAMRFTETQRILYRIAEQIANPSDSTLSDEPTEDKSLPYQNSDQIAAELPPNQGHIAPELIHRGS